MARVIGIQAVRKAIADRRVNEILLGKIVAVNGNRHAADVELFGGIGVLKDVSAIDGLALSDSMVGYRCVVAQFDLIPIMIGVVSHKNLVETLDQLAAGLTIDFIIDGGGSAITTGNKGHLVVDFNCTILGYTIVADVSGSIQITIKKSNYEDFPTTSSIVGGNPVVLSSAQKNQDESLSGWISAISRGDILEYVVDSVTTVTRVTVALKIVRR